MFLCLVEIQTEVIRDKGSWSLWPTLKYFRKKSINVYTTVLYIYIDGEEEGEGQKEREINMLKY